MLKTKTAQFNTLLKKDSKSFLIFSNIFLAILYFFISHNFLKFASINKSVTPIWPSTGLAIFILAAYGKRYLPSIFLGALATNLMNPAPLATALIIAVGNTLEAYIGCWIFEEIKNYRSKLQHLTEMFGVIAAALIGPVISASIGVASLYYYKILPIEAMKNVWLTWWIADAVGALIVFPLLINCNFKNLYSFFHDFQKSFLTHIFFVLVSIASFVCAYLILENETDLKYLFVFFPMLLCFTFIKNKFYILLCSLILCAETIFITISGNGPFSFSDINQNLVNLEIFLSGIAITTLCLTSLNEIKFINQVRVLMLSGWLFWGAVFFNTQENRVLADKTDVDVIISQTEEKINKKMEDYVQVLKSGRGLFLSSNDVSRDEWHEFVAALSIERNYSGMNGMGVIYKVNHNDLAKHAKKFSTTDVKFEIHDLVGGTELGHSNTDQHYIITYLEPFEKNRKAIGLNLASEKNRRDAADESARTGQPRLTKKIRLVQDQKLRPGFLLYLPVYKKHVPLNTESERRTAFSHWIYGNFVTEEFFKSIFTESFNNEMVVQIFEKDNLNESEVLFEKNKEQINEHIKPIIREIDLNGEKFIVKWSKGKKFASHSDFISTWIGLIGAMSVLGIVIFIVNIQELEEKSKVLAEEMHQNYLNSQALIRNQEATILESQKMATLGEMASSIAHEINNPLAIIVGNVHLLTRQFSKLEEDETRKTSLEHLDKIGKTALRIEKIVKGMRHFSRDASLDDMRVVKVNDLIEDSLTLCHERFRNGNVTLNVKVTCTGEIYCRDTQISQVILNLLNNSFDAIQSLDDKWVEIIVQEVDSQVEIVITDSGLGIPKEIQQKIFMPFFTTKEIGKGTGLGLSISRGIVESHKGTFKIDQNHPHTRFIIQLPAHKA